MWWRIAAVVLFLLSIACTSPEPPAADSAGPPEVAVEGGEVVRRLEGEVGTLNFVMHSTQAEKLVLSHIHDALLDFNQKLEIVPALARAWEVSPDGRVWRFQLDPNATFSDGTPVLARDVVFTLNKVVDPKSESGQLAGMVHGLDLQQTRALDDRTVQVVFARTRPSQIYAFNIAILPEHVYSKGDFTKDFNDSAVGAGPYTLASRVRGQEILLERREDYWRTKPYADAVRFRVIEDDGQAWNALMTGEIDETNVNADQWLGAKDDPAINQRISFLRFYELGYNFIPWNTADPILADPQVRRALTMCLDRRLIIERLYHGTARIITGPFPPNHWAFNPAVSPIEFNPPEARRILEQAGWTDSDGNGVLDREGKPFEIAMLLTAGDSASVNQAQIFQDELSRIGVALEIQRVDMATLISRVLSGEFQATMLAWSLDLDPDLYSTFHSSQFPPQGQNFVHYSNPTVDRLIEQSRVEFDQQKRTELFRQLHGILAEQQPYTFTIQVSTKWAVAKRIRNVEVAEAFGLFGWHPGPFEWWIAPDPQETEPAPRE